MNEFQINILDIKEKVIAVLKQSNKGVTIYSVFNESLKELNKKIKFNHGLILSYLDDHEILFGFWEFEKKRSYNISSIAIKKSRKLSEFVCFIFMFNILLSKVDSKGRNSLFGRLKKHLTKNTKALLHEFETFVHLRQSGFHVDLSELNRTTITEYTASKNKQDFNIECKSVSKNAGFPIIQECAGIFLKNLDMSVIKKNCKLPCIINYTFNGRLVSDKSEKDDFLPHELAMNFNQDLSVRSSNVVCTGIDKNQVFNDNWRVNKINLLNKQDPSSFIIFSFGDQLPFFIQLRSQKKSTYIDHIVTSVKRALEQFKKNGNSNPDVLYIYLEGIPPENLGEKKLQNNLEQIIAPTVNSYPKPLLIFFRSHKDEDGLSKIFSLWNKDFSSYTKYFTITPN